MPQSFIELSNQLTHLIREPGEDPYLIIKDRLISLYSLTDYKRFETLINLSLSGDITPSILMSSMLNLYLKGVICGLFFCRMPPDVCAHLLDLDINDTMLWPKMQILYSKVINPLP